jgi:hypothetical protein
MLPMPWSSERAREARAAKLEHLDEQVATGALVIRHMTASERAAWERERKRREALMTPTERARNAAILRERRRRSDFAQESD